MKKLFFLAVLGCSTFCSFPSLVSADAPPSETTGAPVIPSVVFRTLDIGERSGCVRPAKMLISDEKEWQRVWSLHSQAQGMKFSAPPVDFSKQAVVALLMGNQPEGSTVSTVQIVKGSYDTIVYYSLQYGPRGNAPISQPFHFAVIDKPAGKVRFANSAQECAVCVIR